MAELKPCPACGSKIAKPVLEYDVKFPQLGYVRCREITCGLKTGLFADGGRHAVEIWNSLPRTDEMRGVVHCKDCKWCHAGYCEKYDDLIPWGCANKPWEDWFCADGAKMEVSEDD